ncbi:MAG: hypothetical protein M1837_000942 [Sclerophora amabilis]|nr:MAG: hypothetical protein M1837_000942 [Sclerophora amabilis]
MPRCGGDPLNPTTPQHGPGRSSSTIEGHLTESRGLQQDAELEIRPSRAYIGTNSRMTRATRLSAVAGMQSVLAYTVASQLYRSKSSWLLQLVVNAGSGAVMAQSAVEATSSTEVSASAMAGGERFSPALVLEDCG